MLRLVASVPQGQAVDARRRVEQASDIPTLDVDVQSCRSECTWLIDDKPPWD